MCAIFGLIVGRTRKKNRCEVQHFVCLGITFSWQAKLLLEMKSWNPVPHWLCDVRGVSPKGFLPCALCKVSFCLCNHWRLFAGLVHVGSLAPARHARFDVAGVTLCGICVDRSGLCAGHCALFEIDLRQIQETVTMRKLSRISCKALAHPQVLLRLQSKASTRAPYNPQISTISGSLKKGSLKASSLKSLP